MQVPFNDKFHNLWCLQNMDLGRRRSFESSIRKDEEKHFSEKLVDIISKEPKMKEPLISNMAKSQRIKRTVDFAKATLE